jgi:hypothetical protein
MALRTAAACFMALLGISYAQAAEVPAQSVAGTYEVLICTGSCASARDQDVVVKGRVVLFANSLRPQELARVHLPGRRMRGEPNGCFALEKVPGRTYEGYAGIEDAELTSWSIGNDELTFTLFRSPDAGYKVAAHRAETGFTGTGRSWGAGVAAPKVTTPDRVVLRRTGAADLSQCPRGTD